MRSAGDLFRLTEKGEPFSYTAVRNHLTKLLWFEDRLSSLGLGWLSALTVLGAGVLVGIAAGLLGFLEDLAFLIAENDFRIILIALGFVLIAGTALWVLSCCLGALSRRLLFYLRGW